MPEDSVQTGTLQKTTLQKTTLQKNALKKESSKQQAMDTVKHFLDSHPDMELFEVLLPDLNGNLRGKWLAPSKLSKALQGKLKLPLSTLAFDVWGRDSEACVFDSGDADGIALLDLATLAEVPWLDRSTGQVLMSLRQVDGQMCGFDGRHLLDTLVRRLSDLGLTAVLACEIEFNLFAESLAEGTPQLTDQTPGAQVIAGNTYGIEAMQEASDVMHAINDACRQQGLPVDTLIKEAGPSQYEINLYHQADALKAADQAVMLKRLIKGVARQHGYRASFMAKPFGDAPGNGMHVHCSLLNAEGDNVFNDGTELGTPLLRQAIAGCLQSMSDAMLLFAPHLNSYRRFQKSSHAPLSATWGYENRTVAIRVPADAPQATRIEHRVAGADANPYLVVAAILGGMLLGIERQLEAPEPVTGNGYAQDADLLPAYWPEAQQRFLSSAFIRDYFGEEFQTVFGSIKQQELDEFNRHVSTLEYEACL
ncbi:glutamine synthetase family protein [Pseudomaricurvus hydrocarbonicus]